MLWTKAGLAALGALVPGIALAQGYEERRLIDVARAAVEAEVRGLTPLTFPRGLPAKPVFVTIECGGVVRGCRGDLTSRTRNLEEEITLAARSAAAHDPRYRPLSRTELGNFLVTVTIVERMEPIDDVRRLLPEDGLVLRSMGRTGIVLPWEGKDPAVRLNWAYQKAGVARGVEVSLFRLVATRFRG